MKESLCKNGRVRKSLCVCVKASVCKVFDVFVCVCLSRLCLKEFVCNRAPAFNRICRSVGVQKAFLCRSVCVCVCKRACVNLFA